MNLLAAAVGLGILYGLLLPIYRVYFHPLAGYKGPKLFAITNFTHIFYTLRGEWIHKVSELHERYGPIVRVAPNEISYVTEAAWGDIYKASRDQVQLTKHMPTVPSSFQHALFDESNDAKHRKVRKILSHNFSDRGIRESEQVLLRHMSHMVDQLLKTINDAPKGALDLVVWYQNVTTDVIGDMLTNESFGAVSTGKAHPLLKPNYEVLKGLAIGTSFDRSFITRNLLVKTKKLTQDELFTQYGKERFDRYRDTAKPGGKEIAASLIKDIDTEAGLDYTTAWRVAADFLLAGTDTVAITLSGATYLLLRNPTKLKKLQHEVRFAFTAQSDITLAGVNALSYQNAVLMETLRLWPPGPETTRRIVPPGGKLIDGAWVPAKTLVGVYHRVAGRYSGAWANPTEFVPERWLAEDPTYVNDDRGVMNPYNIGPRNCVGQVLANAELRLILASMILGFDWELENPSDGTWMDTKVFGLVAEKRPLMIHLRPATK